MCAAAGGGFFNMSAVVPKADCGSPETELTGLERKK
jgi:hypothetical protein